MTAGKFVSYCRVSTLQQGRSGLGLEAQQAAVTAYLGDKHGELVGEFVEVETGKGANALAKRPQLRAALAMCKKHGATLIIAKLDRLARNVHFISGLLETRCEFVAADMPHANKVMIQMHAVMAEWERDQISARTKSALIAAKARGVALGAAGPANLRANLETRKKAAREFAHKLKSILDGLVAEGFSQEEQVAQLNSLGIGAPRGGRWSRMQLHRINILNAVQTLPIRR
ncbi:recombinase family protein [Nevskia ramosa]|uniref:recombinase family protein n=1 Tax=Nevskia ramosa TaxID=64002 RepID=UPI0003B68C24|nr:recombinase family protein [Nevskia ramosa]